MGDIYLEENTLTCRIDVQHGDYEQRTVTYTAKLHDQPLIIEDVPALVCSLYGDTLFSARTLKRIERMKESLPAPIRQAPVFTLRHEAYKQGA